MSSRKRHVFRIYAAWLLFAILSTIGCQKASHQPPAQQEQSTRDTTPPQVAAAPSNPVDDNAIGSSQSKTGDSDSVTQPAATESTSAAEEQTEEFATDVIPENRLLAAPTTGEAETEEILDKYVGPDQRVRDSLSPPPDAKPIGRDNHLWIDRKHGRVFADGYVTMRRGVLEMFACPMGTKEHEAVVATLAKSKEIHAALLAIGAVPGTPVQFIPKFVPATGQVIRVWVCWRDNEGKFHTVDARQWINQMNSENRMDAEWVFAGSGFWKDPADGREYYQADGGDMICVSNFSTAMLDISIASSAESDQLMFQPATEMIPERATPVRLVLVPIPNPIDVKDDEAARRWAEETEGKKNDPPIEEDFPPLKPPKLENAGVQAR